MGVIQMSAAKKEYVVSLIASGTREAPYAASREKLADFLAEHDGRLKGGWNKANHIVEIGDAVVTMSPAALEALHALDDDFIDVLPVPGGHKAIHERKGLTYHQCYWDGLPEITR